METTLKNIGNSKGIILPKRLITKYQLTELVAIEETEDGILIKPISSSFKNKLETLQKNKIKLYSKMASEANVAEEQHYYANSDLSDADLDLIEE